LGKNRREFLDNEKISGKNAVNVKMGNTNLEKNFQKKYGKCEGDNSINIIGIKKMSPPHECRRESNDYNTFTVVASNDGIATVTRLSKRKLTL
jgi:hypothetical protein